MSDLIVMVATIVAFCGGIIVSSLTTNSSWTKDCEAIGMHLYGSSVYKCELRK